MYLQIRFDGSANVIERGYTLSSVVEILFSPDSKLILISTLKNATRHVFAIDPIPPSRYRPFPY
jgi:hypothetical protein